MQAEREMLKSCFAFDHISIHGGLITEVFNGQTKRQAGPHRSRFSTNPVAVNTWIKMTHFHAKMRETFAEKIKQASSSTRKELGKSARSLFRKHTEGLKEKL